MFSMSTKILRKSVDNVHKETYNVLKEHNKRGDKDERVYRSFERHFILGVG